MKHIIFINALLMVCIATTVGQMKEGKIVYERTINMRRNITDPEMKARVPETRTDKFELLFNEQAALFRTVADEDAPDPFANNGGDRGRQNFMFRMPETTTFTDLTTKMQYEARSFFEKDFLIVDSLKSIKWKLSDETKTIAKHLCKKATTTATQMMRMGFGPPPNGGARRDSTQTNNTPKEIEVVVWYTEDIPVAVGPESYFGLPGAILEVNSDNGGAVTTATEISAKYPKKELVKPVKGEKMNRAEFQETMRKIFDDMRKNGRMPGMRPN